MAWYLDIGPESDVVISSRIRLARNINGFPFPALLQAGTARLCYDKIAQAFFMANSSMRDNYIDLNLNESMNINNRSLVEKRILSEDLLVHKIAARAIISRDESVSIMLGEEDHIRIQAMQPGLDLQTAYNEAEKIAILLENELPIAFDERLGFITACPTNVGTGLRASVMLHLPALARSRKFSTYMENIRQAGFAVRGQYGENSSSNGYIWQISNQHTLGLSEQTSISELTQIIADIIDLERNLRRQMWKGNEKVLADKIYRSYGLLSQARLLSSVEAQQELSNLRLGIALGLLPSLSQTIVNTLEANLGDAGVQLNAKQILENNEIAYYRALMFRRQLTDNKDGEEKNNEY